MEITQNCIINGMPDNLYHKDPCPQPSLSSSMASALLTMTEEEAMLESQRLNPNWKDKKSSAAMDFGTLGHEYILMGESKTFEVVPYADFRTNDAKAVRDNILSRGLIPLSKDMEEKWVGKLKEMKKALRAQLDRHEDYPGLLLNGKAEQSVFVKDGNIWLRSRPDWLDDKYPNVIFDYKITGLSFDKWEKNTLWAIEEGRCIQNPHYCRTMEILTGEPWKFVWVVQQDEAPHHIRLIEMDVTYLEEVQQRYAMARQRFENCLKTGVWRGQVPKTFHSYPPKWVLDQWEIDRIVHEQEMKQQAQDATIPDNLLMAG